MAADGLCECGCGGTPPLAAYTKAARGWVKGRPVRFIGGHHRLKAVIPPPPNPAGLCECGCGVATPIATQTSTRRGQVAGEHIRFVHGHHARIHPVQDEPNPSGLCWCGCGVRTPLARMSRHAEGHVKGKPIRYAPGHNMTPNFAADYVVDARGCWIWQRSLTDKGYPQCEREGVKGGHRWYYTRFVGPIPAGHHVHHDCEVKACVNPAHLLAITPAEHVRLHRRMEVQNAA